MISAKNGAGILNQSKHIEGFTTDYYRELIRLAKENYNFVLYSDIPTEERFVLWRHDCDFSLNRAFQLARIESEEGVQATYFINPHCEFYNLFEKKQAKLIDGIINSGHELGLHFDADFYKIDSESQLDDKVSYEGALLEHFFGVKPSVFSFHNPTDFLLSCEKDSYGGLLNCYSKFFKVNVPYCSDSNGYWRYRRLSEVLESASDSCLQVLTHPGWWQEQEMYPRERVYRAVDGRAKAVMKNYDDLLEFFGRVNSSSSDKFIEGE